MRVYMGEKDLFHFVSTASGRLSISTLFESFFLSFSESLEFQFLILISQTTYFVPIPSHLFSS